MVSMIHSFPCAGGREM